MSAYKTAAYVEGQNTALIKLGLIGNAIAAPFAEMLGSSALNNSLADKGLYDNVAKLVAEQGVPIKHNPNLGPAYAPGAAGSPFEQKVQEMAFGDGDEFINMPKTMHDAGNVDMLAHELGHKHLQNKKYLKYLQHPAARALSPLGSMASFIAGVTHDDDRSALTDAAIVGLPSVPLLAGEGYASYKGHKILRNAGATPAQLRLSRKNYLKALGSYGVYGLGGAAINYGLGRLSSD